MSYPLGKKLIDKGFILQQDIEPKHNSKLSPAIVGKLWIHRLLASLWRMPETSLAVNTAQVRAINAKADVHRARKMVKEEAVSPKPARKPEMCDI